MTEVEKNIGSEGNGVQRVVLDRGNSLRNRVLVSFSNGIKAVAYCLIPEKEAITPADLGRSFMGALSSTPLNEFNRRTPSGYCRTTFIPQGFVEAEPDFQRGKEVTGAYRMTEDGIGFGLPGAALALFFERVDAIGLYSLLGQSSYAGEDMLRAPLVRAAILELLYYYKEGVEGDTAVDPRLRDIHQQILVSKEVTSSALNSLVNSGAIEYKHTSSGGEVEVEYARGKLAAEDVEVIKNPGGRHGGYVTTTNEVVRACMILAERGDPITNSSIKELLPDSLKGNWSKKTFNQISFFLSGLTRQGFLERGDFYGGKIQSAAKISESGERIVRDFLLPLRELVETPDSFNNNYGRGLIDEVRSDIEGFAVASAELYYPHSKGIKKAESAKNRALVLAGIRGSDKPISVEELEKKTGFLKGTIREWLQPELGEESGLKRELVNGIYYYYY